MFTLLFYIPHIKHIKHSVSDSLKCQTIVFSCANDRSALCYIFLYLLYTLTVQAKTCILLIRWEIQYSQCCRDTENDFRTYNSVFLLVKYVTKPKPLTQTFSELKCIFHILKSFHLK